MVLACQVPSEVNRLNVTHLVGWLVSFSRAFFYKAATVGMQCWCQFTTRLVITKARVGVTNSSSWALLRYYVSFIPFCTSSIQITVKWLTKHSALHKQVFPLEDTPLRENSWGKLTSLSLCFLLLTYKIQHWNLHILSGSLVAFFCCLQSSKLVSSPHCPKHWVLPW